MNRFPKFIRIEDVRRSTFAARGFTRWFKGKELIEKHERSQMHREAEKVFLAHNSQRTITATLMRKRNAERVSNRESLRCIFDAVFYLARQGQAFRGHRDAGTDEGNLKQLLILLGKYNDNVKQWMHRVEESTAKYTWTSPQIQNEILTLLHHTVMLQLISNVKNNGYFAIIIDETTDLSVEEQVSICVRHVSNNFTIEESFLGFYKTEKTVSATLLALVKDALLMLGLEFDLVRGQAYDGAANMRG